MKALKFLQFFGLSLLVAQQTLASTLYVDLNSPNPTTPYSDWSTAATNIQDAIDASTNGDQILVTNGLYQTGGKSMDGVITNRISVDKAILVQSVNGPDVTIIQGAWDPVSTNGPGAVRCVWMTYNANLSGFTLRGGATRASPTSGNAVNGGGVWGAATNKFPSVILTVTVSNCVLIHNAAANFGGAACTVILENCTIATNMVIGGGNAAGYGGGAFVCNLRNCMVTANTATGTNGYYANSGSGGGVYNCNLWNCAVTKNTANNTGAGACLSTLINCTVTGNKVGQSRSGGGGVANCILTNCIVYYNTANASIRNGGESFNTNYYNSTFSFSCASPSVSGSGNIWIDPQLLADGIHLKLTSPCVRAGTNAVVLGTDIDGQSWSNRPSIGCDEWHPDPVISAPLVCRVNSPIRGLTLSAIVAGQSPFTCFWTKDGTPIQDNEHYTNAGTDNLIVNNFGPADSGLYQVVVTNAFGAATSQVAQIVIHGVDIGGLNPVAPYSSWATAATNIQDAINVASAGDIVLVTNGIYAMGGRAMDEDLTNRVVMDKPITLLSVNGYSTTIIEGEWDPVSTNGPGALRCAYLSDGAVLSGFTLRNGATRATGDSYSGGPMESGGGIFCKTTNCFVFDCVLSNNSAIYGGGINQGTLINSFVTLNLAVFGGGAYAANLNSCTVVNNHTTTIISNSGAGTYDGFIMNSIVLYNYDQPTTILDNYGNSEGSALYLYSCTSPTTSLPFIGNIDANPQFLDSFHIASTSPVFGKGSFNFSSGFGSSNGTDLDGEPWNNPPSIGCDEVVVTNLVGPLSVNILAYQTNLLVNHYGNFQGNITGRASRVEWSFDDGPKITNSGASISHQWTNFGNYLVTFTAYNNDNPAGISASTNIFVQPLNMPQLQSALMLTNGFQFQFAAQLGAMYNIQYTDNLMPPVVWHTLQTIYSSPGGMTQIIDTTVPTGTRFYRILVQ